MSGCFVFGGSTAAIEEGFDGVTQPRSANYFIWNTAPTSTAVVNTKTVAKIDRKLVCNRLNGTFTSNYGKSYEIEGPETLAVVQAIKIGCYRLNCSFNNEVELAVLKDSKGLLSTHQLFLIDFENRDVCGFSV